MLLLLTAVFAMENPDFLERDKKLDIAYILGNHNNDLLIQLMHHDSTGYFSNNFSQTDSESELKNVKDQALDALKAFGKFDHNGNMITLIDNIDSKEFIKAQKEFAKANFAYKARTTLNSIQGIRRDNDQIEAQYFQNVVTILPCLYEMQHYKICGSKLVNRTDIEIASFGIPSMRTLSVAYWLLVPFAHLGGHAPYAPPAIGWLNDVMGVNMPELIDLLYTKTTALKLFSSKGKLVSNKWNKLYVALNQAATEVDEFIARTPANPENTEAQRVKNDFVKNVEAINTQISSMIKPLSMKHNMDVKTFFKQTKKISQDYETEIKIISYELRQMQKNYAKKESHNTNEDAKFVESAEEKIADLEKLQQKKTLMEKIIAVLDPIKETINQTTNSTGRIS